MLISNYEALRSVRLPFANRQHYMHEFRLDDPTVPVGFEDYLPIVTELCATAGARRGVAYMTVDEKIVKAGMSQRRPGPHVDGCFMPELNLWGHGGWNHYCNNIPVPRMSVIVAASVAACKVWAGEFDAEPKNDGDLSHIQHMLGEGEILPANVGYRLSPDCVHESMLMTQDTQRSFLRIAFAQNTLLTPS